MRNPRECEPKCEPQLSRARGRRRKLDWEAIGREYRAGQLSISEIARQHGCSESAIRGHARRHGWSRDLSERIRRGVRAKVTTEAIYSPQQTELAVADGIERGTQVVSRHQRLVADLYHDIAFMRAELRTAITGVRPADAPDPDASPRRICLSRGDGAATLLQAVVAAAERVIRLERQAYALDADREDDQDFERLLEQARARVAGAGRAP